MPAASDCHGARLPFQSADEPSADYALADEGGPS
jgi:hypothetical protein